MKVSPNAPCPCGSERKLKKCCARFHRGAPAMPRELMPARYTAYAMGDVDFVMATTHPDGPQWEADRVAWKADLIAYCRATRFTGLEILEHELDEDAERGHVTFRAHLEREGQPNSFVERSLFLKHEGRWKYHSGEMRE